MNNSTTEREDVYKRQPQDRYEQMSQKYSEEYYALKAELATLQEQLSAYENAGGFQKYALFTHMTIAENIAFGLKIKGKSKAYIDDKIKYA